MDQQTTPKRNNTETEKDKPLIHLVKADEVNTPNAVALCGITITRPPIKKSKQHKHNRCEKCWIMLELLNELEN